MSKPILFGGQATADAHATVYADTLFGIYQTPLQLLGGNYAVAAAIPFIWLDVSGTVTPPIGPSVNRSDSASGLGDITLYPFMLGWTNALVAGCQTPVQTESKPGADFVVNLRGPS